MRFYNAKYLFKRSNKLKEMCTESIFKKAMKDIFLIMLILDGIHRIEIPGQWLFYTNSSFFLQIYVQNVKEKLIKKKEYKMYTYAQ